MTASVGEGLTRWTRRERDRVTGIPVIAGIRAARLYYGIAPAVHQSSRCASTRHLRMRDVAWNTIPFKLEADYAACRAISRRPSTKLVEGLNEGLAHQTLLGVTGSRQDIHRGQRDRARAAPDDGAGAQQDAGRAALRRVPGVLSAQFGGVLRLLLRLLPAGSVRALLATRTSRRTPRSTSTSSRCACRRRRRCSSGRDSIIVATVSSIYGLGDPAAYLSMILHLVRGDRIDQRKLLRRLADMQYTRNELDLHAGHVPRARRCHRHLPGRIRARGGARRAVRRHHRVASRCSIR